MSAEHWGRRAVWYLKRWRDHDTNGDTRSADWCAEMAATCARHAGTAFRMMIRL